MFIYNNIKYQSFLAFSLFTFYFFCFSYFYSFWSSLFYGSSFLSSCISFFSFNYCLYFSAFGKFSGSFIIISTYKAMINCIDTTADMPAPTSPKASLNPKNVPNGRIKTRMKIKQNYFATLELWRGTPKLIWYEKLQIIWRRISLLHIYSEKNIIN